MILCPDNRFSSTWTTLQCQVNISALYIDHLNEVNYQYGIETVLCKVLACLADEMVSYLSLTWLILAQGIQAGHVVIRSDKCHFLQVLLPPKGYHGYQLN